MKYFIYMSYLVKCITDEPFLWPIDVDVGYIIKLIIVGITKDQCHTQINHEFGRRIKVDSLNNK